MATLSLPFRDMGGISRDEAVSMARESALGVLLVLALGYTASLLAQLIYGLDALVASVVLGMAVRLAIGSRDRVFFKLLPGIIVAQAVFIPIGITLYGINFDVRLLLGTDRLVVLQVVALVACTFGLMYVLGTRVFGLKPRMVLMLGFGSGVCGASAIALTAPVTDCEPDETAIGLVNNTIAVVLCLGLIAWILRPLLPEMEYAALAGALLHQTGFVKMALLTSSKTAATFGLAVKSLRIALLTVSIPAVSYIVRGRFCLPWFLVAFVLVGLLFSYVPIPSVVSARMLDIYSLCFTAALASVGLNADLRKVGLHLLKPLALILLVFAVDLGLFLATAHFLTY